MPTKVTQMFCSTAYLIFVIFLHRQNFWRIKFTPKKRVTYDKIHSKLPIFCVITAKYTVNCQIFALNLKKFTPAKKIYTNIFVGFVTNMRYAHSVCPKFRDVTSRRTDNKDCVQRFCLCHSRGCGGLPNPGQGWE